jgi:predicted nucleotidyltransferase
VTPEEFITNFCEWARKKPDVAGILLVGSHARGKASPESDIDLVLLTSQPALYLDDLSWVSVFGSPSSVTKEDWGKVQSVRVFYPDGLEIEYGITTPDWVSLPVPQSTRKVLAAGVKLLFDRTGKLAEAIEKPAG